MMMDCMYLNVFYLLDVAGKALVEVLHIFLLFLPGSLDRRDPGLRHQGVRSGRSPNVAIVTGSLAAAGAGTGVGRTIDDKMSRRHHRLVDGRRRVGLVRGTGLVRGGLDAACRALGRTFAGDAHLSHVDNRTPTVIQRGCEKIPGGWFTWTRWWRRWAAPVRQVNAHTQLLRQVGSNCALTIDQPLYALRGKRAGDPRCADIANFDPSPFARPQFH